jgi:hypothetical protein
VKWSCASARSAPAPFWRSGPAKASTAKCFAGYSRTRSWSRLDGDYVEEFKLRDLYDEVWGRDAADLMNDLDHTYGAVILGDCIAHMRKRVGQLDTREGDT